MKVEIINQPTWESFKEQMDYFLQLLKQEELTEDTKLQINHSMQSLIKRFVTPMMYIPLEEISPSE